MKQPENSKKTVVPDLVELRKLTSKELSAIAELVRTVEFEQAKAARSRANAAINAVSKQPSMKQLAPVVVRVPVTVDVELDWDTGGKGGYDVYARVLTDIERKLIGTLGPHYRRRIEDHQVAVQAYIDEQMPSSTNWVDPWSIVKEACAKYRKRVTYAQLTGKKAK
jgi:hypothetical protein